MKIYFQNEHTAENGKSEYSLGWNNFEKKNFESGHCCDLKRAVF